MLSSCFGWKNAEEDPEREPLLPQYKQDTHLQRELYAKLHSYQMLRALSQGYMPSTEQTITNLRTLLSGTILNADKADLSDSGRRLIRLVKLWLQQFITLLKNKNDKDQLQDLIWFLTKSRITLDIDDLSARAKKSKTRADAVAAYQTVQTIGSLLLTNSDFRIFLGDLNIVGREIFKDSAFALSTAAENAGKRLEPSEEEQQRVANPGADGDAEVPTSEDLTKNVQDVGKVAKDEGADMVEAVWDSAEAKFRGDEGQTMMKRLQQAVIKLRSRQDYSESVSTLALLIKRYAMAYSRAAQEAVEIAQEDIQENQAADRAMHNLWLFVTSLGDKKEWQKVEELFHKVLSHKDTDPEFEDLIQDIATSLQKLLTDPEFFNNAEAKLQELREKSQRMGKESSLRHDIDELLQQLNVTFQSVLKDNDIHNIILTTRRIFDVISPKNAVANTDLIHDGLNHFIPELIAAIQYLPIPRIEVSTPAIDLLLETVIIEPGRTINNSSFFPYRLKIENYNEIEIRKARFGTATTNKNLMLIKVDGLSVRAEEMGFWLRAHKGLLRLADEGIASFELDERGIDVHFEVEIAHDHMEEILSLRAVRVRVHKLNFKLRKSKFSWLTWLLKPFLRPILKATMEKQLASAMKDFLHAANRELVFARERLRATRVADPKDFLTFIKAVAARLVPPEQPDVQTRIGVGEPGEGVFKGVYAPGSVVKVWNEEGRRAGDRIEEFEVGGWRNEVFDTPARTVS